LRCATSALCRPFTHFRIIRDCVTRESSRGSATYCYHRP
jgi:hypothetical protein